MAYLINVLNISNWISSHPFSYLKQPKTFVEDAELQFSWLFGSDYRASSLGLFHSNNHINKPKKSLCAVDVIQFFIWIFLFFSCTKKRPQQDWQGWKSYKQQANIADLFTVLPKQESLAFHSFQIQSDDCRKPSALIWNPSLFQSSWFQLGVNSKTVDPPRQTTSLLRSAWFIILPSDPKNKTGSRAAPPPKIDKILQHFFTAHPDIHKNLI